MGTFKLKMLVLGDAGTNKTEEIRTIIGGAFEKDYKMTIGCDIYTTDVHTTDEENTITVSIWDIAGQDRFSFFRQSFYRGSAGAVVFFDTTRYPTFNPNVVNWLKELWSFTGRIPIVLYGTKADLVDMRAVRPADVEQFARQIPCHYCENTDEGGFAGAIEDLAGRMLNHVRNRGQDPIPCRVRPHRRPRVRRPQRPQYAGPILEIDFENLLDDLGVTYTDEEAIIFRDEHYFRVVLLTGQVYVHQSNNPNRYARICLVPEGSGWSNTTLERAKLEILSKIVTIASDNLPVPIYRQIHRYIERGTKGKNLFPQNLENLENREPYQISPLTPDYAQALLRNTRIQFNEGRIPYSVFVALKERYEGVITSQ